MNLRFIERDGKIILQEKTGNHLLSMSPKEEWQDVPTHKEPEAPKKPLEFWINPITQGDEFFFRARTDDHSVVGWRHVTEIPKGYKLINKTEVISAWGNLDSMPGDLDKLLNQLGLKNE